MTTLFVDASALVAMVVMEEDGETLSERLDDAGSRTTSAIAIWEAVVAISRVTGLSMFDSERDVRALIDAREIEIVPIVSETATVALIAHRKYGKGRHPAALNMGDCFAYAGAKQSGARLLYKGNDFAKTDLA